MDGGDLNYSWGCKQAPESGETVKVAPVFPPPQVSLGVASSWPGGPWRTLASGRMHERWDWISGVMNIQQPEPASASVDLAGRGWVSGSP